jgi:hypothetical protein
MLPSGSTNPPHRLALPWLHSASVASTSWPRRQSAISRPCTTRPMTSPSGRSSSSPATSTKLFWHRRLHPDAGHRWLREQLARWFCG